MEIVEVNPDNFEQWLALTLELWPDFPDDMRQTMTEILHSPRETGFLLLDEMGAASGFINLSLRYEYVSGAIYHPVAYVEGIYISPPVRRQGLGTYLIRHAETWAQQHGCSELASDALLDNTISHTFHQKVGFREVERVITFIKPIAPTRPPTP